MEEKKVLCPACGAEMERKLQNFSIGAVNSLLFEQYDVDLYACPICGKVELYTANFWKEEEEPEEMVELKKLVRDISTTCSLN